MKTKICSKCGKRKLLKEFSKNKHMKDGFVYRCKKCAKIYYQHNKEKIAKNKKEYHLANKKKINKYKKEHNKKYPWKMTLRNIKQRCNNPKNPYYNWYGKKGIKCLITEEELKELWFRDKAHDMQKPQISRNNHYKNYIFDNCKYEEKLENVGERNTRVLNKIILQYGLDGVFIREWPSITAISKYFNCSHSAISRCVIGKSKSSSGFKWVLKRKA